MNRITLPLWKTLMLVLTLPIFFPVPSIADHPIPPDFNAKDNGNQSGVKVQASSGEEQNKQKGDATYGDSPDDSSDSNNSNLRYQPVVAKDYCDRLYRDVVTDHPCWRRFRNQEPEPEEEPGTDPLRVLHSAVAIARVDGAGLVVEPNRGWVYKDVPTLAHATHQQLTTSVSLFDLTIPVQFTATDYTFDFHSGNPPIHTSAPGAPYPDMSIQTVYTAETPHAHVTLTTLWDATVTHPTTGDTLTIPAALRTIENSPPFKVIPAKQRLISPNAPQPE